MTRPISISPHDILLKIFPRKRIIEMAREAGAFCRRRKVDIAELFWVVMLGFVSSREPLLACAVSSPGPPA